VLGGELRLCVTIDRAEAKVAGARTEERPMVREAEVSCRCSDEPRGLVAEALERRALAVREGEHLAVEPHSAEDPGCQRRSVRAAARAGTR